MTRSTVAALVVLTVLLAAGCSTEYEMVTGRDGTAPDAAAEPAPEAAAKPPEHVADDSAAGLPGADHPGLSGGREAEGARWPEEPVDTPAEADRPLPGQPSTQSGRSAAPNVPPPVRTEPAPVGGTARTPPATTPPTQSGQLPIRLSAGVALAQSLPIGTTMGFSVDYQFTGGEPGSSPYVWVIEPAKGQTIRQPVQLRPQGTLQGFFPPLRPENGPFSTHIEDAQGNRMSKSLPLR